MCMCVYVRVCVFIDVNLMLQNCPRAIKYRHTIDLSLCNISSIDFQFALLTPVQVLLHRGENKKDGETKKKKMEEKVCTREEVERRLEGRA